MVGLAFVMAFIGSLGMLLRLGFWVCPGLVLVAVIAGGLLSIIFYLANCMVLLYFMLVYFRLFCCHSFELCMLWGFEMK